MKQRAALTALSLLVSAVLVSCTRQQPPVPEFDFRLGTLNAESLGTNLYFGFQTKSVLKPQDVEVEVTGPAGWNNGQPLKLTLDQVYTTAAIRLKSEETIPPITGKYVARTIIGDREYRAEAYLNAANTLEKYPDLELNRALSFLGQPQIFVRVKNLGSAQSVRAFVYKGNQYLGQGYPYFGISERWESLTKYTLKLSASEASQVLGEGGKLPDQPRQVNASITTVQFLFDGVTVQIVR